MTRLLILLLVLVAAPAAAEDLQVYESIDRLSIGRVFLRPVDRAALDRRRHEPKQSEPAATASSRPAEPRPSADRPAGYIENSSGRRSNWRGGDFVSDSGATQSRFPGDVPVERHEPRTSESEDDERSHD